MYAKLVCFVLLLVCGGNLYAATGDITSVEIPASGSGPSGGYALIEIEGFTTGMSFDLGDGDDEFDVDGDFASNAHIVFTVTSQGYTHASPPVLSTTSRTVYGTIIARQASPNEADANESTTMGGVEVYVWLSQAIYNDDTLTVDITASTFTNTGGSSETSNAASALSVTNNSTLDYPEITAQLNRVDGVNYASRVEGDSFDVAVFAFATYGIRCVEITATGQTSANVENEFIFEPTASASQATGEYAYYYSATIDNTGFTDDELIDVVYQVYPFVGDADTIVDTTGNTGTHDEILGRNVVTVVCDKDSDSDSIKYCATTGDDGTGDGSSMSPYRNPSAALDDTGTNRIILQDAGTYTLGNSNTNESSNEWVIVEPTGGSKDTSYVIEVNTTRDYNHQRLKVENCRISMSGDGWLEGDEAGNHLWFHNCDFQGDGNRSTVSVAYQSDSCVFTDCTGDLSDTEWAFDGFSSSTFAVHFDGCQFDEADTTPANYITNWFAVIRCESDGSAQVFNGSATGTSTPTGDGLIFAFNRFINHDVTDKHVLRLCNTATASGGQANNNCAVVGNVIEKSSTGSAIMQIAADNSNSESSRDCVNIKILSNTLVGGSADPDADGARVNLAYNNISTDNHARTNWCLYDNAIGNLNIKADLFTTANGARVGGWHVLFGVNSARNYLSGNSSDTFRQEYVGADSTQSSASSPNDFKFADHANDDFAPAFDSSLVEQSVRFWDSPAIYDLNGKLIKGDIGAVQTNPKTMVRIAAVYDIANTKLVGPKEPVTGASSISILIKAGCQTGLPTSVSVEVSDGVDTDTKTATLGASPYEFTRSTWDGATPYCYTATWTTAELTTASIAANQMLTVTATASGTNCLDETDAIEFYYGTPPATLEFWIDSDSGDDGDDGLSEPQAKLTLRDAMDDTLDSVNNIADNERVIFNLKRGTTTDYILDRPASSQTSNQIAILIRPYGTGSAPVVRNDATDSGIRVNHIAIEDCTCDLSDGTATGHSSFNNSIDTNTDSRLILRNCTIQHDGGRDGGASVENAPWVVSGAWGYPAWSLSCEIGDIPRQAAQGTINHFVDTYFHTVADDGVLDPELMWGVRIHDVALITPSAHVDSVQWSTSGDYNSVVDGVFATTTADDQGFVATKSVRNVFMANWLHSGGNDQSSAALYSQIGTNSAAGTDPFVHNFVIVHSGWSNGQMLVQGDSYISACVIDQSYAGDFDLSNPARFPAAAVLPLTGRTLAMTFPAANGTADDNYGATVADAPDWGDGISLPTYSNVYVTGQDDYTPGASSELLALTTSRYVAADMFGNAVAASGEAIGPIQDGNTFGVDAGSPSTDDDYQNLLQRFSVEKSIDGDDDGNVTVSFQIKFKATRDRTNETLILAP